MSVVLLNYSTNDYDFQLLNRIKMIFKYNNPDDTTFMVSPGFNSLTKVSDPFLIYSGNFVFFGRM